MCSQITHYHVTSASGLPQPGRGSSPERTFNWRAPAPLPARRSALQAPHDFFLCLLPLSSLKAAAGSAPSGTSNWLELYVRTMSGRCVNVYYTLLTFDDIKVRKKGSIDKSIVKAGIQWFMLIFYEFSHFPVKMIQIIWRFTQKCFYLKPQLNL